jgi:nicotinate-nucleotide pyrophosphorylase (carboxylating)
MGLTNNPPATPQGPSPAAGWERSVRAKVAGGTHARGLTKELRIGSTRARHDPPLSEIERVVRVALAEDFGGGDVTTNGTAGADTRCRARLLLKETGVVCGLPAARAVFLALDPTADFRALVSDGDRCDAEPTVVAEVVGLARSVLTGERTALNLLGRLSGVATRTARYVEAVTGTGAKILDTRKTTPGLRALEKYAVRCGGGVNHRFGLDGGILVKDNHLVVAGGIPSAVRRLRAAGTQGLPIEVEADTLAQVDEALAVGVDRILLDNMSLDELREAVARVSGRAVLEASGGVSLETVRPIAETGVDFVSVGGLTHSAPSLDVSLEVLQ